MIISQTSEHTYKRLLLLRDTHRLDAFMYILFSKIQYKINEQQKRNNLIMSRKYTPKL